MTSQEPGDDLKLDPETVKDLEPGDQRTGAVKGGILTKYNCTNTTIGQSDGRLKRAVRPVAGALARLRQLDTAQRP